MRRKTKIIRVSYSFDRWINNCAAELSKQTGEYYSRSRTIDSLPKTKLTTKRGRFDWRLV